MLKFDYAMRATKGAREYQEDAAVLWPDGGGAFSPLSPASGALNGSRLAVLADGMGGHAGGALASAMCCETFVARYAQGAPALAGDNPTLVLLSALEAANEAIAVKVESNPLLSGMGSTLVAVMFGQDGIHWVSVGDSPLLLWRRGEIALLNEDHSLAPDLDALAVAGKITSAQAKRDPRRHMLRSAVTGDDIDLVDVSKNPLVLESGDFVILASDGLQTLDNSEIGRIVSAYGGDGATAVAAALIRTIDGLREPHQDNATVVVVGVG
jgi:PPM family protein phosphatase